jgi:DNA-binding transcriptional MerR regulator
MSENATREQEPDASNADTSLEEIEARLDELRDEKQQADALSEAFTDATDALDDIRTDALVDDETAAKVELLKQMLRQIRQFDVHAHESIHHEREALHRQGRKLKRAEDGESR